MAPTDKRARPPGPKNDADRHDFVRLLETPLELCARVPAMSHTCRIYEKLYGLAKGRVGAEEAASGGEGKASTDTDALTKSLHRCALSDEAWRVIDHPTRLRDTSRSLLDEVAVVRTNLEHWMDAFAREPGSNLAMAAQDHQSDAFLNGIALLQSIHTLYQQAFAALRPCMANLETFNERKDAMNELGSLDPKVLIPCVDPEAYQLLDSEVEEVLRSHRQVPVKSRLRGRSILRSVEEARQVLALQDAEEPGLTSRIYDGLARCTQRGRIPGASKEFVPGLVQIIDAAQQNVEEGSMKARGAQRKPEARLNRRYSIESLFGTSEDRILSYLRKRSMALLQNELLVDMYSLCSTLLTLGLALAEALRQSDSTADFIAHGHVLASLLIGSSLPLMEKTLSFEPSLAHFNVTHLTLQGLSHEEGANRSMHRQIRKLRIIDKILEGVDVHVFPWTSPAHYAAVRCIARSRLEPKILLTAGDDRVLRIWDVRTGACLGLFVGHKSIVSWCTFSLDDRLIISASFDMTLKIWDSRTGRCSCTLTGHTDSVLDGALSANGKLVLSASMDGSVRLWSLDTGACFRVYRGHREGTWVKAVRFLPGDLGFVSAGLDGRVALWNIHSAPVPKSSTKRRRQPQPQLQNEPPLMAPYAPHLNDLAEDAAREEDVARQKDLRPVQVFTDLHSDCIVTIEVLERRHQSPLLITASKDGSQQIVDLGNFELLKSIMCTGASTWAIAMAISPDRRYFALAHYDNTVHIHAMHNYILLRKIHVQNHGITRVLFAEDASYIVVGTSMGRLQIFAL